MEIRFLSRLLISAIIAVILVAIIWATSQFREPPDMHPLGLLILVIVHLTFEMIFWFWKRYLGSDVFPHSRLSLFGISLGSILLGTISFAFLFYIFKWIDYWALNSEPPGSPHFRISVLSGLILSIVFTVVQLALYYNRAYYRKALENERNQNKLTQANLAILTHQLDPHFLFNNFNTLYYLIDENQDLAKRFLKNMSNIYRHILQSKDQRSILAMEEYGIARQYLAMLQQRYEEALVIDDQINADHLKDRFLPPLVMQQLLENIVKHNQVDTGQPLGIQLSSTTKALTIQNKIIPKPSAPSTGIGLPNIVARYEHLGNNSVQIEQGKQSFSVTIPLL